MLALGAQLLDDRGVVFDHDVGLAAAIQLVSKLSSDAAITADDDVIPSVRRRLPRFELIRLRELGGSLKIVSSYLTEFDGTFGYAGGEHVSEHLADPG